MKPAPVVQFTPLNLDGVRYAVIRENLLRELCRRAGGVAAAEAPAAVPDLNATAGDDSLLGDRFVERRRRVGLSQADLARRAGVRIETLNRIERGRTTPDFATIRKLVIALKSAEDAADAERVKHALQNQETRNAGSARSRRTRSQSLRNRR